MNSTPHTDAEIEARLDELERESLERTAELKEIAAQLPAAVGRRAMLRALVGDVRAHPDKGEVARRGARKLGRIPTRVAREVRYRLRRRPNPDA